MSRVGGLSWDMFGTFKSIQWFFQLSPHPPPEKCELPFKMCFRTNLRIAWLLHLQNVVGFGAPDSLDMERAGKHEWTSFKKRKTLKHELQFIPNKSNPKSNLFEHHGGLTCSDFLRWHESQQKQVSKISRTPLYGYQHLLTYTNNVPWNNTPQKQSLL